MKGLWMSQLSKLILNGLDKLIFISIDLSKLIFIKHVFNEFCGSRPGKLLNNCNDLYLFRISKPRIIQYIMYKNNEIHQEQMHNVQSNI